MKIPVLSLLIAFLCIGNVSSTWAGPPPQKTKSKCINSDPILKKTLSHFSWRSNDPQFKPDFCDPKNLAYRLAEAVLQLAINDTLYSNSAHAPDDHGVLASGPFHFFSSRIQTFVFEPNTGICAVPSDAYVSTTGDGIMHICPYLANEDDVTVTSSLVHEARHHDGDGFPHVRCMHGKYAGFSSYACDESGTGGAYAVEAEYLVQVSRIEKLDPSIRQSARSNAIQLLVERLNTLPMGIQKGAVLVSDNSKLSFYNGESAIPLHPLTESKTRPIKLYGVLNFYDPEKNTRATLADGINLDPNPLPLSREASGLLDNYENRPVNCQLYSNRVTCGFWNDNFTLPIKDFTPVGFFTYDPLDQSDPTVYIVSKDQRLHVLSLTSKTFASTSAPFKNLSEWNEGYYITLGFDGKILFAEKDPNATAPFVYPPGLNPDDTFTKMIAPYYWSKELQEL